MKKFARIISLIIFHYTFLATAQTPTQIIIFQAYVGKETLNPRLVVAQRYSGSCFTHSLTNHGRTDAWRCSASNVVLDPCFEDSNALACVTSPWSTKAAILELSTPLHRNSIKKVAIGSFEPWSVELENGAKCTFLTGASSVINHQRVTYSCNTYHFNVLGKINRSSPVWKALVHNFQTKKNEVLSIKKAWY